MLPLLFATGAAEATVTPRAAAPATAPAPPPADTQPPPRYRDGVVIGFTVGGGIARGAGYPNDSNAIGHSGYASSGWIAGPGVTALVMGALADYLNVGFWFAHANFLGGDHRATSNGGGLRVEAFPFVYLGPGAAGIGLFSEFGFGTASLTTTGALKVGGSQSYIGAGMFYEWAVGHILGGHFGIGPSVEYDAVFTQPYDQNGFVASLRAVWYRRP
ncbi:MAG: hypothetical protein FWD17_08650 [Polyangiaceae bacterium]|nr:hypothetical protein [Polyangiaceae bacterium]